MANRPASHQQSHFPLHQARELVNRSSGLSHEPRPPTLPLHPPPTRPPRSAEGDRAPVGRRLRRSGGAGGGRADSRGLGASQPRQATRDPDPAVPNPQFCADHFVTVDHQLHTPHLRPLGPVPTQFARPHTPPRPFARAQPAPAPALGGRPSPTTQHALSGPSHHAAGTG